MYSVINGSTGQRVNTHKNMILAQTSNYIEKSKTQSQSAPLTL